MDDSRAMTPNGSLDLSAAPFTSALGRHSRHNSYSSHTSRITYNSHADLTKGGSRELHWRRSGPDRTIPAVGYRHDALNNNNNTLPHNSYNNYGNGVDRLVPEVAVFDRRRQTVQFPESIVLTVSC